MKTLLNEIKRMQQLAGILKESQLNEYGEDSGGQDMTWSMYNEKPRKEKGNNQDFIDKGYSDYYDDISIDTPPYEHGINKYYKADLAKLWKLGWKKAESEDKGIEFEEEDDFDEYNPDDDQSGDYNINN